MTIDPHDAAASLDDIASVQRRTQEALYYAHSGATLMLWGVTTSIGYLLTFFDPDRTRVIWFSVTLVGFLGTFVLTYRRRARGQRSRGWRFYYAMLVLMGFGALIYAVLGPWDGRQHSAFWPLLVMMGFVLGGLWVGRFFVVCGVVVSALTLFGYYAIPGHWFILWLAVVEGAGLIVVGWWMRRTGSVG